MQIEPTCVAELYSDPNFKAMVTEYSLHSNKLFPPAVFKESDYLLAEKAGTLAAWRVMSDGVLCGFMSMLSAYSMHFGVTIGVVESLFVMKKYRMSGAGKELVTTAKEFAKSRGLAPLVIQCPYGAKLAKLLEAEGFSPELVCYCVIP